MRTRRTALAEHSLYTFRRLLSRLVAVRAWGYCGDLIDLYRVNLIRAPPERPMPCNWALLLELSPSMTLSSHLRDTKSPVRAYLNGVSPVLAASEGNSRQARQLSAALGLTRLAASPVLVPAPPEIDTSRVGTAFEIRTLIALDGFDSSNSSAASGVQHLILAAGAVRNGHHRARILAEASDIVHGMLDSSGSPEDTNRASLVFALGEQIYRGGLSVLEGSLGKVLDSARDGRDLVTRIPLAEVAELDALLKLNALHIESWRHQGATGHRFVPGPSFEGSDLVGGADADWLVKDTLIDCKVYGDLSPYKLRGFLRQLLGYVMLDTNDVLKIRNIGIWLPRQKLFPTWSLESLLGGDPGSKLPKLRKGFVKATRGSQLAHVEQLSQLRKHQLLADNLHTPQYMLEALARSDDKSIRFRIGRNPATQVQFLRRLARDRYAIVREGVAKNPEVPADVVRALSDDKSVVVRRAASKNPVSHRFQPAAITTGATMSEDVDSSATEVEPATTDLAPRHAQVSQIHEARTEWVVDLQWLTVLLRTIFSGETGLFSREIFPQATRTWALISGRRLEIPRRLLTGLPVEIMEDLFHPSRPVVVRRIIASNLPIEDQAVRDLLVSDSDAEIRWSALRRSVELADNSLPDLLTELASSRTKRIRFRTNSEESSPHYQLKTPAELNHQMLVLVARHRSTPSSALETLVENKSPDVLLAVAQNPNLDAGLKETLIARMKSNRSQKGRQRFSDSSYTPIEVLEQLSNSRSADIRAGVALNTSTPPGVLTKLADDRDVYVRMRTIRNIGTPNDVATRTAEELLASTEDAGLNHVLSVLRDRKNLDLPLEMVQEALDRLSKSRIRDPDVRKSVARDDRSSSKTLERLAQSVDTEVRVIVAGNQSTSANTLTKLAEDQEPEVRRAVARSEVAGKHFLGALAHDEDAQVRLRVASNPHATNEVLQVLLRDEDTWVRRAALHNPELEDEFRVPATEQSSANPQDTYQKLQRMATSTRAEVRTNVAFSPKATPDLLDYLAGTRSVQVRRAVAANPNTPIDVMWSLVQDKDLEVRQALALNEGASPELLVHVARLGIDYALLVSLNPAVSDELLRLLSNDTDPLVQHVAVTVRTERMLGSGGINSDPKALDSEL